jgi:hypothetical protein
VNTRIAVIGMAGRVPSHYGRVIAHCGANRITHLSARAEIFGREAGIVAKSSCERGVGAKTITHAFRRAERFFRGENRDCRQGDGHAACWKRCRLTLA